MQRRVLVRDVNYFGYVVEFVIWIIQYGNETSNGDFVVQGNLYSRVTQEKLNTISR